MAPEAVADTPSGEPSLTEQRLPLRRVPQLLRNPLPILDEAVRGHDVVRLRVGPRSVYLVNHPPLIERILGDRSGAFVRVGPERTTEWKLAAHSVAVLDGDEHARRRHAVEAVFEPLAMRAYAEDVVAVAAGHASRWRTGTTVDLERELTDLHLATIGRVAFGRDDRRVAGAVRSLYGLSRSVLPRGFNPLAPLLWHLPLPLTRQFDRAQRAYHDGVAELAAERRAHGGTGDDLLGRLLRVEDADGRRLTDEEVRGELWTYLAQGAPVYTLLWAWWALAHVPPAQRALRDELLALPAGRRPAADDLPSLPVARGIVLETLRLHPTSVGAVRRAARDVAVGGSAIPAGAIVIVPYRSVHRDDRHWPDPDRFDHARAHDGGAGGPYLTFGAGTRACPARSLAVLTATLQLATIARDWRVEPLPARLDVRVVPFVSPRGGLPARLERVEADTRAS